MCRTLFRRGYVICNLSIERKAARKYRLAVAVRLERDTTELKWRSPMITTGPPRGRDAAVECAYIVDV